MLLNGRKAILSYVGKSWKNRDAWRRLRGRYQEVLVYDRISKRVWCLSEDLDRIDREQYGLSLDEFLSRAGYGEDAPGNRGTEGENTGSARTGALGFQEVFDRIVAPSLRKITAGKPASGPLAGSKRQKGPPAT